VPAVELAFQIEITVAMQFRLMRGDAGAERITRCLPIEALTHREPRLRKLPNGLLLERRIRGRQGMGAEHAKACEPRDEGADQPLSSFPSAHPLDPCLSRPAATHIAATASFFDGISV
jgi:hypothetical protein